jgi:hypothetical protein
MPLASSLVATVSEDGGEKRAEYLELDVLTRLVQLLEERRHVLDAMVDTVLV